jgi:uncharacterized membrane protein (DUF485 family)
MAPGPDLLIKQSIILLVFFIPYVLVQFPSSILVRKIGPRHFLSGITFAWGVVMMVCLLTLI